MGDRRSFQRVDAKLFVAIGEGQVEVAIDDEVVEIVARGERAQLLWRERAEVASIADTPKGFYRNLTRVERQREVL